MWCCSLYVFQGGCKTSLKAGCGQSFFYYFLPYPRLVSEDKDFNRAGTGAAGDAAGWRLQLHLQSQKPDEEPNILCYHKMNQDNFILRTTKSKFLQKLHTQHVALYQVSPKFLNPQFPLLETTGKFQQVLKIVPAYTLFTGLPHDLIIILSILTKSSLSLVLECPMLCIKLHINSILPFLNQQCLFLRSVYSP